MLFVPFLDFDRVITGLFLKRNSRETALPSFILTRDKHFYFLRTDRHILIEIIKFSHLILTFLLTKATF